MKKHLQWKLVTTLFTVFLLNVALPRAQADPVGAILGGIAGSQFGQGNGKIAMTIAGAVAGDALTSATPYAAPVTYAQPVHYPQRYYYPPNPRIYYGEPVPPPVVYTPAPPVYGYYGERWNRGYPNEYYAPYPYHRHHHERRYDHDDYRRWR